MEGPDPARSQQVLIRRGRLETRRVWLAATSASGSRVASELRRRQRPRPHHPNRHGSVDRATESPSAPALAAFDDLGSQFVCIARYRDHPPHTIQPRVPSRRAAPHASRGAVGAHPNGCPEHHPRTVHVDDPGALLPLLQPSARSDCKIVWRRSRRRGAGLAAPARAARKMAPRLVGHVRLLHAVWRSSPVIRRIHQENSIGSDTPIYRSGKRLRRSSNESR